MKKFNFTFLYSAIYIAMIRESNTFFEKEARLPTLRKSVPESSAVVKRERSFASLSINFCTYLCQKMLIFVTK